MSANVGLLYDFGQGFEFSSNAAYTGSYFSESGNSEKFAIDSYWVANAQLAYVLSMDEQPCMPLTYWILIKQRFISQPIIRLTNLNSSLA